MTEEQELIFDLFVQGCQRGDPEDPRYDHGCVSAYENAQGYLISHGIITAENCTMTCLRNGFRMAG